MRFILRKARVFSVSVLVCVFSLAGIAEAKPKIYLMRGLANVFSLGMDELATKLRRLGYSATVTNHAGVDELAAQAARAYKSDGGQPVVVIGHSYGADATATMAARLKSAGVPVALLVAFGPSAHETVPSNVARAIVYRQSNGLWNATFRAGPGFHGSLSNIDLAKDDGITHFNIEKSPRLQAAVIAAIRGLHSNETSDGAASSKASSTAASAAESH